MYPRHRCPSRLTTLALALAWVPLSGCPWSQPVPDPTTPAIGPDRNAATGVPDPLGESVAKVEYLDQGWSPAESQRFYFTSQGSQIVPYDWFLALEKPDDATSFRENANMLKFRYLIQKPDALNPDGLPVGFVKDQGRDRAWLGLSCAACHTAQVDYQGVGYRIDGGPSPADVRGFLASLTDALKATRDQGAKFARFAARVLGRADGPDGRGKLQEQLTIVIDRRAGYNARNFPAGAPPGYGRVDAFGAIMNEVYHHAVRATAGTPATANTKSADAPVSYPCLWDTPQHKVVQWNGAAQNAGLGSLGRNVGEVLGVFADFEIPDPPSIAGYPSSVQVRNLLAIEGWLAALWSPQWPASFPPIDPLKRDQGKLVYEKAKCRQCHNIIDRKDPKRAIDEVLLAVGTDARMADNFSQRMGAAGKLEGAFVKVFPWPPLHPDRIGKEVGAGAILGHTALGTIIGSGFRAPEDELSQVEYRRPTVSPHVLIAPLPGGIYKARPLNGIWATAPYLHNGSVANLDQLLRPARQRLEAFSVGSRQFDPVHVGFRTDAPGFPTYRARDDQHQPIAGNSNEGHEYGTELGDEERGQLIEYLKSL